MTGAGEASVDRGMPDPSSDADAPVTYGNSIPVTPHVGREVDLLAAAWGVSTGDAVGRLVDHFHLTHSSRIANMDAAVQEHIAVYRGVRVEGLFVPRNRTLTITSPPLAGRVFTSPSGARAAVVRALNPSVAPNGSGWDFWIITATGRLLSTLRYIN